MIDKDQQVWKPKYRIIIDFFCYIVAFKTEDSTPKFLLDIAVEKWSLYTKGLQDA